MPVQIQRLLIAFAVFIALFLLIRNLLLPDSFGKYGHYRGDALDEIASGGIKFTNVGETCALCHDSIAGVMSNNFHKSLNCQVCHGPGHLHVDNPEDNKLVKPEGREFCGRCHAMNVARSKDIKQINIEEHNKREDCLNCHNPHEPWK